MCHDDAVLSACFDSELTPDLKQEVETHVKECPACKKTLEEYTFQKKLLHTHIQSSHFEADARKKAWYCISLLKQNRLKRHNQISIPIPIASTALIAIVVMLILSLHPLIKQAVSPVDIMAQNVYSPTVLSRGYTPGEVDAFFTILEGQQGFTKEAIHTLPDELQVFKMGEPFIIHPASIEGEP